MENLTKEVIEEKLRVLRDLNLIVEKEFSSINQSKGNLEIVLKILGLNKIIYDRELEGRGISPEEYDKYQKSKSNLSIATGKHTESYYNILRSAEMYLIGKLNEIKKETKER